MLLSKMEYKNAKANIITKPIKNYKYKNLSEDEKIKKLIMLTTETKICQMKIEKEKKLLNHLINRVEDLENVSLNK